MKGASDDPSRAPGWAALAALSVGAIALCAGTPLASGAVPRHEHVPTQLLNQFPLNPQNGGATQKASSAATTTAAQRPAGTAPPPQRARQGGRRSRAPGGGASLDWLLVAGACLVLALVLGVALARRRVSQRRGRRAARYAERPSMRGRFHRVRYTRPVRIRHSTSTEQRGEGAFNLGVLLEEQGDAAGAEEAYRHAAELGFVAAHSNLGVLLQERGELRAAEQSYRHALERGDGAGAFNLGLLLEEKRDFAGARSAYLEADRRGHGAGACNLGVLLEGQDDLARALVAYSRADQRGDPKGAFNLGMMLEEHGDLAAAQAAYRRAEERRELLASSIPAPNGTPPETVSNSLESVAGSDAAVMVERGEQRPSDDDPRGDANHSPGVSGPGGTAP